MADYIIAIDQGTTSSRAIIFDKKGSIVATGQKEHEQILPKAGWVEHDAAEIWANTQGVVRDLATSDINDGSKAEFNDWLATQVGGADDDQRRVDQINRVLEKHRAVREAREAALAAKTTSIKAAFGEAVSLPDEKLGAAKKAFLNLAQELTPEEWLRFSRDYAKEVNDHLKASKPAAAASAAAAAP